MVSIKIDGGNRRQRKIVRDFIKWLAYHLLDKRMADNLVIFVEMLKVLNEKDDLAGTVGYIGKHERLRIFTMEFCDNYADEDLLRCIAHEMIHVKQDCKNEKLSKIVDGIERTYWKKADHTETEYDDQPWEKEAYKLERKLVERYLGL